MATTEIADLWRRFETWLKAEAPATLATLQDGATPEEIAATEALLGVSFPDDVRASYLLHNGQTDYANGLLGGREFLSLARIQREWKIWKELLDGGDLGDDCGAPSPEIQGDWWNPKWIPLTHDGGGNHDCLDLAPTPQGNVGQIISFWHDEATRTVEAKSFTAWLAGFVEGCETGVYVFSEEDRAIVRADEL